VRIASGPSATEPGSGADPMSCNTDRCGDPAEYPFFETLATELGQLSIYLIFHFFKASFIKQFV
jgi:hypothetical protein